MFKKLLFFVFAAGLLGGLAFFVFLLSFKSAMISRAESRAQDVIMSVSAHSVDQMIIALTRAVHDRFTEKDPSSILLLRLRPYLTHRFIPGTLRLPDGVIEANVEAGMCDNAVRYLNFVLVKNGYEAVQWNMVTDQYAHSVSRVTLPDGRYGLLDPLHGVVGYDHEAGTLRSPEDTQQALKKGRRLDQVILTLDEDADVSFYQVFDTARMAARGEALEIDAVLPRVSDEPISIGEIDGRSDDVMVGASENGMTPFWSYVGHKYDRSWVRTLRAPNNVVFKMTLVSDIDPRVLTAQPAPQIDGRDLIWNLGRGDAITFVDGQARMSLWRLNSYLDVDQITIYPN